MSNRRDLKKQINESMGLLYNDCILYKVYSKNANQEKADEIISQLVNVHNDLLSRVSISEGKEVKNRTKAYYKKIKEDLKLEVDKLGAEIEKLD